MKANTAPTPLGNVPSADGHALMHLSRPRPQTPPSYHAPAAPRSTRSPASHLESGVLQSVRRLLAEAVEEAGTPERLRAMASSPKPCAHPRKAAAKLRLLRTGPRRSSTRSHHAAKCTTQTWQTLPTSVDYQITMFQCRVLYQLRRRTGRASDSSIMSLSPCASERVTAGWALHSTRSPASHLESGTNGSPSAAEAAEEAGRPNASAPRKSSQQGLGSTRLLAFIENIVG